MYVPAGSRLTWTGNFGTLAFALGFSGIMQAVSAQLQNNYALVVESENDTLGLTGIEGGSVTLHVLTNIDRGGTSDGIEDIRGNISDTFAANNVSVQGSSITDYKLAAGTNPISGDVVAATPTTATGAPVPIPQATPSSNPFGSWWDKFTTQAAAGSIGFIIGGVAVVGLLVYMAVKP